MAGGRVEQPVYRSDDVDHILSLHGNVGRHSAIGFSKTPWHLESQLHLPLGRMRRPATSADPPPGIEPSWTSMPNWRFFYKTHTMICLDGGVIS